MLFSCPHNSILRTDCITGKFEITQECHCKSDCVIEAKNSVFGNPCVNTYKYVNITYLCVRNEGKYCM